MTKIAGKESKREIPARVFTYWQQTGDLLEQKEEMYEPLDPG